MIPPHVDLFADREPELGDLDRALAKVTSTRRALAVWITGAPGMGKRRLIREYLRRTSGRDDVLVGTVKYGRSGDTWSVWSEVAEVVREEARRRDLPVLSKLGPSTPTARALAEWLGDVSALRPLIVAIEQVHASREDFAGVVHDVVDRVDNGQLLLILEGTLDEQEHAQLIKTMHELRGDGKAIEIPLNETLRTAEQREVFMRAYLAMRSPDLRAAPETVELLAREYGSSPELCSLAVESVLSQRLISTDGALSKDAIQAVSPVVTEHLRQLWQNLDRAARDLLMAASVEGETFTVEILAQIQGTDPAEVEDLLTRTLSRWVRPEAPVKRGSRWTKRVAFVSRAACEYARARADEDPARWHDGIAGAMEVVFGSDAGAGAGEIADHFRVAADYAIRAGRSADLELAKARRWYGEHLARAARDPEERVRTLISLAAVLQSLGERSDSNDQLVEAAGLAIAKGLGPTFATPLVEHAFRLFSAGKGAAAVQFFEAALGGAPDSRESARDGDRQPPTPPWWLLGLAVARASAGDERGADEALSHWESLIEKDRRANRRPDDNDARDAEQLVETVASATPEWSARALARVRAVTSEDAVGDGATEAAS